MYPHKQKTSESAHTLSADDAMQNLQLAATFIVGIITYRLSLLFNHGHPAAKKNVHS